MRCAGCGEAVEPFLRHCPACGAALPASTRPRRPATQAGLPIARYVPGPSGSPVLPDAALPRPRVTMLVARERPSAPVAQLADAARPTRHARSFWRLSAVLLTSAALALVLWRPSPAMLGSLPLLTASSHPAAAPCAAPPVRAAAARALTAIQLATRLRDPAHGDYRPADATATFQRGQPAYLTFEIATNAPGTAAVLFCTAHERIHGMLRVPAGSAGRYGQFSAVFAYNDPAGGKAILTWNGQVAAVAAFVSRPAGEPHPTP